MATSTENAEFFVVGGPVQPDRPCYIARSADEQLLRFLDMGEFCTVFVPRQCGKTSLIGRSAKRLRSDGRLAAVVDLTQMGTLEYRDEPSRWFYTIAYRIVRDLRLKVDLQEWWRDRAGLSNLERMSEFFWEIVLGNTTAPIVVFFDDLETLVGLPSGPDFLATIRGCYERRVSEPDYQRLSFVLAGVVHPSQFPVDPERAPFEVSYPVVLDDFSLRALNPYAVKLDDDEQRARVALRRVHYWSGGQPYLTQKLCRTIARQGLGDDPVASVDALVETLFLQPNIFESEPHLNAIRHRLLMQDDRRNSLLTLYGRIRKGQRLMFDPAVKAQVDLLLSGIVRVNDSDTLELRNPLYGVIFTARWVNQSLPLNWRGFARAGAVVALVLFLPYWYTQILPSPFIRTLSGAGAQLEEADSAFRSLRRIPGYRNTAVRLYEGYLLEKGSKVLQLKELEEVEHRLRHDMQLPDQAQKLVGAFWSRRAALAERQEDRDSALMFRLRALQTDSSQSRRRIDALIDQDFRRLVTTIRPVGRLDQAVLSPDGSTLVTLESGNQVRRWDTASGQARSERALELLAQEFVPVGRHLSIDEQGQIRDLELTLVLNHFRPDDLIAILTSPSGRSATLPLAQAGGARDVDYIFNTTTFAFSAASSPAIKSMVGDERKGTWTLSIEDRDEGVTGMLIGWGLQFTPRSAAVVRDRPQAPVQIPDPSTTGNVKVVLGPAGRLAAATSAYDESRGYIFTWDLLGQEELTRIPEPAGASMLAFADQGEALVVANVDGATVSVWDARSGSRRFQLKLEGRLASPPVYSPDGRHMLVSAQRADQGSVFEIWDLRVGKRTQRLQFDADVTHLALAPGGRRMAASFRDNLVRIWDVPGKKVVAELFHSTPVTGLVFDSGGRWIALTSRDRRLRAWRLAGQDSRAPQPDLVMDSWDAASLGIGKQEGRLIMQARPGTFEWLDLEAPDNSVATFRHGAAAAIASGADPALAQLGGGLFSGFALETGLMFTAERGGFARVWRTPDPGQENRARGSADRLNDGISAISPDGTLVVSGNAAGEVIFRSADEAVDQSSVAVRAHAAPVNLLSLDADGKWMASGAADGSLRLWNVAERQPAQVAFRNDLGPVRIAIPSRDGSKLATAGDYGVRLWNARTGEALFELPVASAYPVLALQRDGTRLLVPGGESLVHIRDTTSGELLQALPLENGLSAAGYSLDDRFLVLADRAGSVRVYRSEDYSEVGEPVRLGGPVLEIGFVPGGNAIVARTYNWLHLLSMTTRGLYVRASRLAERGMGPGLPYFPDRSGNELVYPRATRAGTGVGEAFYFDARNRDAVLGTASNMLDYWGQRLGLEFAADGQLVTRQQAAAAKALAPETAVDSEP